MVIITFVPQVGHPTPTGKPKARQPLKMPSATSHGHEERTIAEVWIHPESPYPSLNFKVQIVEYSVFN